MKPKLKTIIVFVAVVCIFVFTVTTISILNDKYLSGDIDNNGRLSATDLCWMKRHLIGTYDMTEIQIRRGDVNGNGRIDQLDIDEVIARILQ